MRGSRVAFRFHRTAALMRGPAAHLVQRRAIIDTMFDCGLAALEAERIDGGLSLMHDRG